MNRSILSIMLALPLVVSAQQEGFKIEGQVKKAKKDAKAYLSYRIGNEGKVDSVQVKGGKFTFTGDVSSPTLMNISLVSKSAPTAKGGEKDSYNLFVDKGTTKLVANDSIKYASLTGAPIGMEYVQYAKALENSTKGLAVLDREWAAASAQEKEAGQLRQKLQGLAKSLTAEKQRVQKDYMNQNPNSYFALLAMQDLSGSSIDIAVIEPAFNKLSAEVKNTTAGQAFAKRIESAKSTQIGAMAPDFTQNDVNDKPVKLSDFRGKYVLLDFWASWCGPCRQENPHVVAAYHKYKDKNFTILGVSLDNPGKKDAWLKAIADDKLEWTNVSDLQGWKNAASAKYGVRSIPQNYLIGPDGRIVASNLRGAALDKKLEELLK